MSKKHVTVNEVDQTEWAKQFAKYQGALPIDDLAIEQLSANAYIDVGEYKSPKTGALEWAQTGYVYDGTTPVRSKRGIGAAERQHKFAVLFYQPNSRQSG